MGEDLLDHPGILDAEDDLCRPATGGTHLDIDAEELS